MRNSKFGLSSSLALRFAFYLVRSLKLEVGSQKLDSPDQSL